MSDIAKHLGISVSYVSAVENRNKRAFDGEMLNKLANFLNITEDEATLMFDLAGRENHVVPYGIEDTLMYEEVGELARYALHQSKKAS